MTRDRFTLAVVVVAYGLALAASYTHIAQVFAQLESPGQQWVGYVAALGIDGALAALALAVHVRARAGYGTTSLWVGVVVFAALSAWANALHTLQVLTDGALTAEAVQALDPLAWANTLLLSASLPLVVVYLAHVIDKLAQQSAGTDVPAQAVKAKPRAEPRAEPVPVQVPAAVEANGLPAGLVADAIGGADPDRVAAMAVLLAYLADNPEATMQQTAEAIGRHRNTASAYVSQLQDAGLLGKNGHGMWVVSKDVQAHLADGGPSM